MFPIVTPGTFLGGLPSTLTEGDWRTFGHTALGWLRGAVLDRRGPSDADRFVAAASKAWQA